MHFHNIYLIFFLFHTKTLLLYLCPYLCLSISLSDFILSLSLPLTHTTANTHACTHSVEIISLSRMPFRVKHELTTYPSHIYYTKSNLGCQYDVDIPLFYISCTFFTVHPTFLTIIPNYTIIAIYFQP